MRRSGRGNEMAMLLIPLAVIVTVALAFYGGPGGLAKAMDRFLRDIYNATASFFQALF